jgi:hypothetical protein
MKRIQKGKTLKKTKETDAIYAHVPCVVSPERPLLGKRAWEDA